MFYDISSMKLGEFDKQIFQHINTSDYFILILSVNALDGCCNEEDWVRMEIECALNNKIQIIPLILPQFKYPQNLPNSIKKIKVLHGIEYNAILFDLVMNKLYDFIGENNTEKFQNKKDLVNLLNELYGTSVGFRNAFRQANEDQIKTTVGQLCTQMQNVYYYYERNIYTEPKLSELALSIVNQFNTFVRPYNEFAKSKDTMSPSAQKAEDEFHNLVSLMLKTLNDLNRNAH